MRKIYFILVTISVIYTTNLTSQNIQLHYDFGSSMYKNLNDRPNILSTVEFFHPDKWGSTFLFVDMTYNSDGVAGAYWQLQRNLRFWDLPLSIHLEYHGGNMAIERINYLSFYNAYFAGAAYNIDSQKGNAGAEFSVSYYYLQKHDTPHNFKISASWYYHFAKELCTFSGFVDFWREINLYGNYILLTEPQIWFNFNKLKFTNDGFNLSIGSEVKVSNNFVGDGLFVIPTATIKWTFR